MIKPSFFLATFFLTCINVFAQSVNPFTKYLFDQNYSVVGLGRSRGDSIQKHGSTLKDTAVFNLLKPASNFAIDQMPRYPDGLNAFYDYVENAFQWPEAAISARVSGKLIADFIIEKDGSIADVRVVQDLGYGIAEEFIRVLRNSKKWQPGKIHGIPVRCSYTLPLPLPPPPQAHLTLAAIGGSIPSGKKLQPLQATKGQYYFESKLNKCGDVPFVNEDGKQVLSDRFSILNYVVNGFHADTLDKIIGRASYQVVIDSTGKCCTVSFKNETNLPDQSLKINEIVDSKTIWNVLPSKSGKKEAVSAILVFTFTEEKVKYQHIVFEKNSDKLVELEFSEKSKGGR